MEQSMKEPHFLLIDLVLPLRLYYPQSCVGPETSPGWKLQGRLTVEPVKLTVRDVVILAALLCLISVVIADYFSSFLLFLF